MLQRNYAPHAQLIAYHSHQEGIFIKLVPHAVRNRKLARRGPSTASESSAQGHALKQIVLFLLLLVNLLQRGAGTEAPFLFIFESAHVQQAPSQRQPSPRAQ